MLFDAMLFDATKISQRPFKHGKNASKISYPLFFLQKLRNLIVTFLLQVFLVLTGEKMRVQDILLHYTYSYILWGEKQHLERQPDNKVVPAS